MIAAPPELCVEGELPAELRPEAERLVATWQHGEARARALGLPRAALGRFHRRRLAGHRGPVATLRRGGSLRALLAASPVGAAQPGLPRRWRLQHCLHDQATADDLALTGGRLQQVLEARGCERLEVRLPAADVIAWQGLEAAGFRSAGSELEFAFDPRQPEALPAGAPPAGVHVAPLRPEELPAVIAIADQGHALNRHRCDPELPDAAARTLYAAALARQLSDPHVGLLAARRGDELLGFVSFWWNRALSAATDRRVGCLDFIGVAERARGLGLGDALNRAAAAALAAEGVSGVTVRTMTTNFAAQRLLTRLGARPVAATVLLHWWARRALAQEGHLDGHARAA